jgi:hypothetical protein
MTDPINDTRADLFARALPQDLSREVILFCNDRLLNEIAKNSPAWKERINFLKSENLPNLRSYARLLSGQLPEETLRVQKEALLAISEPPPSIGPDLPVSRLKSQILGTLKELTKDELALLKSKTNQIHPPIGLSDVFFLSEMHLWETAIRGLPSDQQKPQILAALNIYLGNGYFDQAQELADRTTDPSLKNEILKTLAIDLAKKNLIEEAFFTINSITEEEIKGVAIGAIAVNLVIEGDFISARDLLHRLPQKRKDHILYRISEILAQKGLLNEARLAANLIKDVFFKNEAFHAIHEEAEKKL